MKKDNRDIINSRKRTTIICAYCHKDADLLAAHVTQSRKLGAPLYCNHVCSGFARRGIFFKPKHDIWTPEVLLKKFEDKIMPEPNTGCWIWTGVIFGNGYGRFRDHSKIKKMKVAHRFSYEVYKGPIPEKLLVCHKCDNRWCVNPDHLFLGTHKDNTADMISKGRKYMGPSKNHASKLSKENVVSIRKLLNEGRPQQELATIFNINRRTISAINVEKVWKGIR